MTGRPLDGRRILVTRRPEPSGGLGGRLTELGAVVVEAPTIEVVAPEDMTPLDEALRRLHRYHWLLFTSPNAIRFVRERMQVLGIDPDVGRHGIRVGSVGPATTQAYQALFGGAVSAQPTSDFRAEGLLACLGDVFGQTLLLPTSDRSRDILPKTLAARGAEVDVVVAYRTVAPADLAASLAGCLGGGIDLATFASPSAVEAFVAAAGEGAKGVAAAVIGPVTEQAARAAGLDVRAVARPSTTEGLVAAVVRLFA